MGKSHIFRCWVLCANRLDYAQYLVEAKEFRCAQQKSLDKHALSAVKSTAETVPPEMHVIVIKLEMQVNFLQEKLTRIDNTALHEIKKNLDI